MATEFQSYFETIVLDFLKSCGGESNDLPLHGTRHALGQLAHRLSSDDSHMTTRATATPIEAHHQGRLTRQRRVKNRAGRPPQAAESESETDSERSSVDVSGPLTPASESSVLTVQSSVVGVVGVAGRGAELRNGRRESLRQQHGMTLRERQPNKRVLPDSESEEEEEGEEGGVEGGEEEEGGGRGVSIRTRSQSSAHKRQRLLSDSEGDEGDVAMVTRTSRGRVVKPTLKFS